MPRLIKTIEDQNVYDLAIQGFGALNNLDKVMRQSEDINTVFDFGQELEFDDTNNNLAIRFQANGDRFATGDQSPIAPVFDVFDDTFDDTFN